MSGAFNVGGLISGLDSNQLISQLMQIERQPVLRLQERIAAFETQRDSIRELRTQLLSLRNSVQDFRITSVFDQYGSTSSDETVLTAEVSGPNPVIGAYTVDVTQLASATSANSSGRLGSAINITAALDSSGIATEIESGTFSINGVSFSVDPAANSLQDMITLINNNTEVGVDVTYDAVSDTVTFENEVARGTSIINFGASDDTSNFLDALNVTGATQTGGTVTTVTSTRNLGAIDPNAALSSVNFDQGGTIDGSFSINGVSITVASTDTLGDVIQRINDSDAEVTASYDSSTDEIHVVSDTLGSREIAFQSVSGDFLDMIKLSAADQTAGNDATFTINGGAVQTRNTNEVADAVGGMTLSLLSVGSSTVTVSTDDDAMVEDVNDFLTVYNESIDQLRGLVTQGGVLASDASLRSIESFLRTTIFNQVPGLTGDYSSLLDIGISTGDSFDSGTIAHLELDEDAFREALRDGRADVANVFNNTDDTGIADQLFGFLDEATKSTGFLNHRAKTNGGIDAQIRSLNDQIDRLEIRIEQKEVRLRRQFTRLEQLSASFQQQSAALAGMGSYF